MKDEENRGTAFGLSATKLSPQAQKGVPIQELL